jgi:trigger factor
MLKTLEEISPTKKRLKIQIPSETIENEIQKQLENLRRRSKIPGFRAGKAPLNLIEKRFGKEAETEALQKLIPQFYSSSIKEAELKPVAEPVFEQADEFKRKEPFNMTLLVEVMPKLESLNYEGIAVKDAEVKVEDGEVDDIVARLREERGVLEPSDGPLKEGEVAIIDYEVKGGQKKFESQVLKVGGPSTPEDFSRALLGKNKGDEFDLRLSLPGAPSEKGTEPTAVGTEAPNPASPEETEFHVAVKDTKKIKLPELDDEFAKGFSRENLEALKEHVRGEILNSKKLAQRKMQKAELMEKLVASHEFDPPASLLDREIEDLTEQAIMAGGGQITEEQRKTLRENTLRPQAVRNVKAAVLLELIGAREKVEVSEEEVKRRIAEISARSSLAPENVIKYYVSRHGSLDALRHAVYEEKVLDLLLEKARLEKPTGEDKK